MLIKDRWYIACPSARLASDKPFPFQVGDRKLVAFRDQEGAPQVLDDRCPHRAVPLSLGRVEQGKLSCGYHGWVFDGDGALVEIPAEQQEGGAHMCVRSHIATEAFHYVWVWVAGTHAQPTHTPHLRGFREVGSWIQYSATWKTPALFGVENNMDATHTPFSHPGNYPGREGDLGAVPKLKRGLVRVHSDDETVVFWAAQPGEAPVPTFEGDCKWGMLFELPFTNYVNVPFGDTQAIYHWIPLSEDSCRLEFMLKHHREAKSNEEFRLKVVDEEIEILRQDRVLLEGAQERISGLAEDFVGVSVESDLGQLAVRRLIRLALESANGRTREPARTKDFEIWA